MLYIYILQIQGSFFLPFAFCATWVFLLHGFFLLHEFFLLHRFFLLHGFSCYMFFVLHSFFTLQLLFTLQLSLCCNCSLCYISLGAKTDCKAVPLGADGVTPAYAAIPSKATHFCKTSSYLLTALCRGTRRFSFCSASRRGFEQVKSRAPFGARLCLF